MNNHQHEHVQLERNINVAILTVSDTRDFDSDKGGQLVQSLLKEINVSIEEHHYKIVKDDKKEEINYLSLSFLLVCQVK